MKYLSIIVIRDPTQWEQHPILPWLQEVSLRNGNVIWLDTTWQLHNKIWVLTVIDSSVPPEHEDVLAVIEA